MSIFGKLFGGKKRNSGLPPEVEKIFDKMSQLMEDEDQQNSMYPPEIRDQIVGGRDVDELLHGFGEFGRTQDNPIPVNGSIGELIYLSNLKTQSEQRILFHRIGSVSAVDIYETVAIDGSNWDILLFSMYHPRKSRKAPTGYSIVKPGVHPLLFGTNTRVDNFPYGLHAAIRNTTSEIFGIPMPSRDVRQAEERVKFSRPPHHEKQVKSLTAELTGYRSTD